MEKSIWDEELEYNQELDIYKAKERTCVYFDDCMFCKNSRSSPMMSPGAHCIFIRQSNGSYPQYPTCGWGYACKRFAPSNPSRYERAKVEHEQAK